MVSATTRLGRPLSQREHLRRWWREGQAEWRALWHKIAPTAWNAAALGLGKWPRAVEAERGHVHPWRRLWVLAAPHLAAKYLGVLAGLAFIVLALQTGKLFDLVAAAWPDTSALSGQDLPADRKVQAFRDAAWTLSVAGAAAVAFFGLLLSAWRTLTQNRQAQVDRQRQETEAFTTAVEQLGSHAFATRLGAIYNLESLARASPRLHEPIMEAFCHYLQNQRPAPPADDDGEAPAATEGQGGAAPEPDDDGNSAAASSSEPAPFPADLQAIITALARRKLEHERAAFRLALGDTDLCRADLRAADLRSAILDRTRFDGVSGHGARFDGAWLEGARFDGAVLSAGRFHGASGKGVRFDGAELAGARFDSAGLIGACFDRANLAFARLHRAGLPHARFEGAWLLFGRFDAADLAGARLDGAGLIDTRFDGTRLIGASFSGDQVNPNITFHDARVDHRTTGLPDWARAQAKS